MGRRPRVSAVRRSTPPSSPSTPRARTGLARANTQTLRSDRRLLPGLHQALSVVLVDLHYPQVKQRGVVAGATGDRAETQHARIDHRGVTDSSVRGPRGRVPVCAQDQLSAYDREPREIGAQRQPMTYDCHLARMSCRAGWSQAVRDSAQREAHNGCDAAGEDNHQSAAPPPTLEFPGLAEQRIKDSAESPPRRVCAVAHD